MKLWWQQCLTRNTLPVSRYALLLSCRRFFITYFLTQKTLHVQIFRCPGTKNKRQLLILYIFNPPYEVRADCLNRSFFKCGNKKGAESAKLYISLAVENSLRLHMLEKHTVLYVLYSSWDNSSRSICFICLISGDLGKECGSSLDSCAINCFMLPFPVRFKDEVYCLRHLQIKSLHMSLTAFRGKYRFRIPVCLCREASKQATDSKDHCYLSNQNLYSRALLQYFPWKVHRLKMVFLWSISKQHYI